MPKNIVVFSDGTGQDGGVRPGQRVSNVYKMYRVCRTGPDSRIDPAEQVAFYDPGLGTDIGATALSSPVRFVQKLLASVTGRGITTNIADCYEFIINHYREGDRIFLIGFSRGAYTVRCVANLLMLCGVPTRGANGDLPRFRKGARDIAREAVETVLEHGAGHGRAKYEAERDELARRFRDRYASAHESGERGRSNAAPYFIGVFDTVAALGAKGVRRFLIQSGLAVGATLGLALVGFLPAAAAAGLLVAFAGAHFWPALGWLLLLFVLVGGAWLWNRERRSRRKVIRDFPNPGDKSSHMANWKVENFDRLLSRFVRYARSANAIDETRKDFDRVAWGGIQDGAQPHGEGPERLVQLWFAGNHSDIGGSYPEAESRLSDVALGWMIEEATRIPDGLKVDGLSAPGDATGNPKLHVFPAADGVQHCEIAGMRDTIERSIPVFLRRFLASWNWASQVRSIAHDAPVHQTVVERFDLEWVPQCAGSGPYRPAALAGHDRFKDRYAVGQAAPPEAPPSA
ncbi:conserved hypothethical protein [Methylorubrum extorquens]|uniref:Conserved hypothethical protein n=1 Tax=Methylorubrum extorquens TaxID=408 RepID=A0A2N9ATG4_METEX|nr:conserved hypothethical protein [Methylorubrum extorquens]